jgi:hypothetical protein
MLYKRVPSRTTPYFFSAGTSPAASASLAFACSASFSAPPRSVDESSSVSLYRLFSKSIITVVCGSSISESGGGAGGGRTIHETESLCQLQRRIRRVLHRVILSVL